jgi:radical SAM protein with 4Fe4S-binding SPASM domain
MSFDLITKIFTELSEKKFSGLLGLFSNNEPLLDKRIVEICALAKKLVPKAHIYIYTNGLQIKPDLYQALFDVGLDEMIIDNYDDDLELIKPVKNLLDWCNNNKKEKKVIDYANKTKIVLRKKNEILSNRGGVAPNKDLISFHEYHKFNKSNCSLPYLQMVIRPTGEVSLCCQDALGLVTMGNVSEQSIEDIWNNDKYLNLRKILENKGRNSYKICKTCDVSIIYKAIPEKFIYSKILKKQFKILK